jgi:HAD superfamily hydrolase (TIGR01450 family)
MRPVNTPLQGSDVPLSSVYDVALLDLDGVVYVGRDAVPTAAAALAEARRRGLRLAFVTNNAARPPDVVAAHLTELGIQASPAEVVTSAQAAAHYLADRLPAGAPVLVVGTTGLWQAVAERGLRPVDRMGDGVQAVVQGYSPELSWRQLAEGAVAIRSGLPWIATNLDATVPSARGPLPGNGSMVAALRHATGAVPVATGKPDPTMHREMVVRTGARRPLVVGDRLDTDIEGATAVGCASLLVLTGVTSPAAALAAPPAHRPTYLGRDLGALLEAHPRPDVGAARTVCAGWAVEVSGDRLRLHRDAGGTGVGGTGVGGTGVGGTGVGLTDAMGAWRALCAAWWAVEPDAAAPVVEACDADAERAVAELGLPGR